MTEFVRVRQFDSEKGGGGGAGKFCRADYLFSALYIASATNPEFFEEHFFKAKKKQTYLEKGGGGSS